MNERIRIQLRAASGRHEAFERMIRQWKDRGYMIQPGYGPNSAHALAPIEDQCWRPQLQEAASARIVAPDWQELSIDQFYSDVEQATAPLFRPNHTGRDINIHKSRKDLLLGVCHVIDVDESHACAACGSGAQQIGELRAPASEMNKSGPLASIWIGADTFYLISDALMNRLEKGCGQRIPRRAVELVGRGTAAQPWWQLDPTQVVPIDAVIPMRYAMPQCGTCGAVELKSPELDQPFGGYLTVDRTKMEALTLEPVVLSPFWSGTLDHFPDGRASEIPCRYLWFRSDLARLLAAERIRGLDLTPIIYSQG